MELAPDLQFKHMTVHDAQLPFEVVAQIPGAISLDDVEICCDLEHHVVNASHTHPDVVAGPRGHALVRGERVGDVGARRRRRLERRRSARRLTRCAHRAHVGSSRADGDPVPRRRQEPPAATSSAARSRSRCSATCSRRRSSVGRLPES